MKKRRITFTYAEIGTIALAIARKQHEYRLTHEGKLNPHYENILKKL